MLHSCSPDLATPSSPCNSDAFWISETDSATNRESITILRSRRRRSTSCPSASHRKCSLCCSSTGCTSQVWRATARLYTALRPGHVSGRQRSSRGKGRRWRIDSGRAHSPAHCLRRHRHSILRSRYSPSRWTCLCWLRREACIACSRSRRIRRCATDRRTCRTADAPRVPRVRRSMPRSPGTRRAVRLSSAGRARPGLRSHQRLELVLAWCQGHAVDQHVPPDVTCCVLRAVDPDEGALTVISVHPEVKSAAEA